MRWLAPFPRHHRGVIYCIHTHNMSIYPLPTLKSPWAPPPFSTPPQPHGTQRGEGKRQERTRCITFRDEVLLRTGHTLDINSSMYRAQLSDVQRALPTRIRLQETDEFYVPRGTAKQALGRGAEDLHNGACFQGPWHFENAHLPTKLASGSPKHAVDALSTPLHRIGRMINLLTSLLYQSPGHVQ